MFSGVVIVEFRPTRLAPPSLTMRVLVRNVENLHDAIVRGVGAAIELAPPDVRRQRAFAVDWVRVNVDAVA